MSNDIEPAYRVLLNQSAVKRATEKLLLFFIALCVAGVLVLLFLQNHELTTEIHNQQVASASRARFIIQSENNTTMQTQEIKGYILCVANYLATPNRSVTTLNTTTCK